MVIEASPCIRVPDCNNVHIPGVLWQRNFLASPGLGGNVAELGGGDGSQRIANVGVRFEESCVRVGNHGSSQGGQEHESCCGFCAQDCRVDSVSQDTGHFYLIIYRMTY